MKALAWKMNLTIILIVLLADLTTLKGANSNPIYSEPVKPIYHGDAMSEAGSKPISNGRPAWPYPACLSKRLTESCNREKPKRNVFSSFYFSPEDVKLRQLLSLIRTFYKFNGIYGYFSG